METELKLNIPGKHVFSKENSRQANRQPRIVDIEGELGNPGSTPVEIAVFKVTDSIRTTLYPIKLVTLSKLNKYFRSNNITSK